ncbi:AAA family ATPase [Streptomyces drozdowiczii]|uniref:AAA family ATPase n=1 Tax=Streptomyces drozdowiczii TaxID=202862 RepID=UPI00403C1281
MENVRHMNPRDPADPYASVPQHIDAELDVLGGCVLNPRHIPAVRQILKGSDFDRPAHEMIWDAIGHLSDTGAPLTPNSITLELERRKELTRCGGPSYVTHVCNHVGGGDPVYFAEKVRAAAALREEADLGRRIVQRATSPDAEPGGTVAFMEEYLQRHKARTSTGNHLTSAFLDWGPFFATDFGTVELLPGRLMAPGQQITIVGDGKAGKSLFVQEWLWRMASGLEFLGDRAHAPIPLLYVDAENGHQDIQERFLSYGAGPGRMGLMSYASFPPIRPLDTAGGGTDLLDMVKDCEAQLVCLDTVSRFISGPENDADTWLALYRHTLLPLKRAGIASVRLDHMGKDGERGARGSSAKTQDVDHVWELRAAGGGSLSLRRTHTRTGIGPDEFSILRHARKDGDRYAAGHTRHVVMEYDQPRPIPEGSVEWLIEQIDGLGLPNDAGNPMTIKALAGARIPAGKDKIAAAVRERKNRDKSGSRNGFPETFPEGVTGERSPETFKGSQKPQVKHSPETSREPQETPPSPPSPPLGEGKGREPGQEVSADTPLCTICDTPLPGFRADRGYDTHVGCDPTTAA